MYGLGVAVGDFNNDGFPDVFITCVGQNRLVPQYRQGHVRGRDEASGLDGRMAFSTSAMWLDFDRDGLLDLFVCNYVKWTAEHDVFCSLDGKQKSYCTPEAYRGETCWLFRNRGNGTFEDVTATCGIFDSSSKSLGVALLDYDQDGWPDFFVANDTQPNKLYRNRRNGRFRDVALRAGVALSDDGKARAGMGVDAGDFDNSGRTGLAVTNFDNEMIGLYRPQGKGLYQDVARRAGIGTPSLNRLGFGCVFAIPISMASSICSSPTATSTTRCGTSAATSATRNRRCCSSTRATRRSARRPARRAAVSRRPASAAGSRPATSTAMATSIC